MINALKALKEPCEVQLFTDSSYVVKGMSEWLEKWQKNRWLNSEKKPVKNKELWMELSELLSVHKVKANWLKGHAGHAENELCDKMAKQEAKLLE